MKNRYQPKDKVIYLNMYLDIFKMFKSIKNKSNKISQNPPNIFLMKIYTYNENLNLPSYGDNKN